MILATHDLDVLDVVADRCLVFSEDHRVVAEGPPAQILADRSLLLGVNLIHEHSHLHPGEPPHDHVHDPGHHDAEQEFLGAG